MRQCGSPKTLQSVKNEEENRQWVEISLTNDYRPFSYQIHKKGSSFMDSTVEIIHSATYSTLHTMAAENLPGHILGHRSVWYRCT